MNLAFTGTRNGLTKEQKSSLRTCIQQFGPKVKEFLHGDCIGADEEFHGIAHVLFPEIPIHTYFVRSMKYWAECYPSIKYERSDYLSRNREMVMKSHFILGCPASEKPKKRGGTWYTLRFAQKMNRDGLVLTPSGLIIDLKSINFIH